MKGLDIELLLRDTFRTRAIFSGVYPIDCLPTHTSSKNASAFVINQDPKHRPGTHWVALYITAFGDGIYMDSFGLPPMQQPLKRFIATNCRSLIYNKTPIQSLLSQTCGLYCVYFIREMSKGTKLRTFSAQFKPLQTEYNDRRVIQLITGSPAPITTKINDTFNVVV